MSTQQGSYNTYIGARYVPIFDGQWNNTKAYEPLVIVEYQGNSYTSKTYVPIGVDINNTDYWALTGNYNAQVEAYRQEVLSYQQTVNTFNDRITNNSESITTLNNFVEKNNKIIVNVLAPPNGLQPLVNDGITDNSNALQAIIDYCYANGGIINFASGNYLFKSTINITTNGIDIVGNGLQQINLICDFEGSLFNYTANKNCSIKNLSIKSQHINSTALYIDGTDIFIAENLNIYKFNTGLYLNNVANSNFNYIVISTDGTEETVKGIVIKGLSVSTYFTKIIINLSNSSNSVGLQNSGNNVADNIFNECDIASCTVGLLLNGEGSTSDNPATDITINNCLFDGTTEKCIHIYKMNKNTLINILGGWFNSSNVENANAIKIEESSGVTISSAMFQTVNITPFNLIKYINIINSDNCKVCNCSFLNGYYQIVLNSSKCIVINGNTAKNVENSVNPSFLIGSIGNTLVNVTNNNIQGYYGSAIELVTGNSKYIICNNIFDKTNINTPITNNSTDSIIENNIVT